MSKGYNCVKWRYLGVVFLVIVLGMGWRVFHDNNRHEQALIAKIEQQQIAARQYLQDQIDALVARYQTLGALYGNAPALPDMIAQRDRAQLWDYAFPDYQRLQASDPNLFVMHFFDRNNRTILRMHQPDHYDDDLTELRPIVAAANQQEQPLSGFEGGKHGITYRVTVPLIDPQDHPFGVLEFGLRPDVLVEQLKTRFNLKTAVLVDQHEFNKQLDRPDAPQMLDGQILLRPPSDERLLARWAQFKPGELLWIGDEAWVSIHQLHLHDYQHKPVAQLVGFKNVTAIVEANRAALIQDNAINLTSMAVLLLAVYLMFNGYSNRLAHSQGTIRTLKDQSRHLRDKAQTDALTGLRNRRFFDETLPKKLAEDGGGALLLVDIDHFKRINDEHGHDTGDEVLVLMARQLTNFFRQDDLVVRWGGEEFVVFIPGMSKAAAVGRAEAFRRFIETSSHNQAIAFTVSIGVASASPETGCDKAFRKADRRLYLAKEQGRNRVIGG